MIKKYKEFDREVTLDAREIKPHVIKWYTTAVQPLQLLVDKEAVMVAAFSARIFLLQQKGAPVDFVWHQAMAFPMFLAIPKGAPHKDDAHRLISFMLQAEKGGNWNLFSMEY